MLGDIEDWVIVILGTIALLTFLVYKDIVARFWAIVTLLWMIWYEIT